MKKIFLTLVVLLYCSLSWGNPFLTLMSARVTSEAPVSFPSTPVLDDFNREALGDDWNVLGGGWAISNNQLGATTSGANSIGYKNLLAYPADQEWYFTIGAMPTTGGTDLIGMFLRMNSSSNGYLLVLANDTTDELRFEKITAGGTDGELTRIYQNFNVGDSLGVRAEGNVFSFYRKSGGVWSKVGEYTDSSYNHDGSVALYARGTAGRIDDFGGIQIEDPTPTGDCEVTVTHDFETSGLTGWTQTICEWTLYFENVQTITYEMCSLNFDTAVSAVGQWAKMRVENVGSTNMGGFMLRAAGDFATFYMVEFSGGNVTWKEFNGTDYSTIQTTTLAVSNDDFVAARVTGTGNDTVVEVWKNPTDSPLGSTCPDDWGTADVTFTNNPSYPANTGTKIGIVALRDETEFTEFSYFTAGADQ